MNKELFLKTFMDNNHGRGLMCSFSNLLRSGLEHFKSQSIPVTFDEFKRLALSSRRRSGHTFTKYVILGDREARQACIFKTQHGNVGFIEDTGKIDGIEDLLITLYGNQETMGALGIKYRKIECKAMLLTTLATVLDVSLKHHYPSQGYDWAVRQLADNLRAMG